MAVASSELKPMAVFISRGASMPGKLVSDGTIPAEAAKLLRDGYVCVYLDTETAAGKELAGRFDLSEGLVISSPGGSVQALRHSGSVSGTDLTGKLTQYATASQPTTTVTSGPPASSVIVSSGVTTYPQAGYNYQPVYHAAPTYQSAPAYQQAAPAYSQTYPTYYASPFGGATCNGPV
jgi:hypothetical protein